MTRTIKTVGLLLMCCAGLCLTAAGQNPAAPEDVPRKAGPRIRENLITLKLLRMTQVLNLTAEQTSVLYPVVTRLETEKYEITQKLNKTMKGLSLELDQAKPDETRIVGFMTEIGGLRDRIAALDKETADFLKTKLSVVQNAKYLLFNAEFYRRLGERLGQLRQARGRNRFTS